VIAIDQLLRVGGAATTERLFVLRVFAIEVVSNVTPVRRRNNSCRSTLPNKWYRCSSGDHRS